jgi:hypothetical protein
VQNTVPPAQNTIIGAKLTSFYANTISSFKSNIKRKCKRNRQQLFLCLTTHLFRVGKDNMCHVCVFFQLRVCVVSKNKCKTSRHQNTQEMTLETGLSIRETIQTHKMQQDSRHVSFGLPFVCGDGFWLAFCMQGTSASSILAFV